MLDRRKDQRVYRILIDIRNYIFVIFTKQQLYLNLR